MSSVPLPSRRVLLAAVILAASLFHGHVRSTLLLVLRLPLTFVQEAAAALATLPRLPALSRDATRLRETLALRELDVAQLREQVRQLQQSRELLAHPGSPRGIVASVIGRSLLPTTHTVLLDRGSRAGLTEATIVVSAAGLVGRVMEVHRDTALVMLLTDPNSRVAALIERSRETGLLVGKAHGRCELIYLDAAADLQEGDQVLTAGLGGVFPKGLRLGSVVTVARDDLSGVTSATVVPAEPLGRLEAVLCVPPAASAVSR